MELNKVYCGDCLQVMKEIPSGSIDMVLADLPYEVTQNSWDTIIPFAPLWQAYERIIKPAGAIILTAQGMFAYKLALSNEPLYRYDIIWNKPLGSGYLNAKKMPLRNHENILVFYKKLPTYNPQFEVGINKKGKRKKDRNGANYGKFSDENPPFEFFDDGGKRYPNSVITFTNGDKTKEFGLHPTQKPVGLFEYLIRTYTNEGETVLDNTIGSGTTAVACLNSNRNFIGIENHSLIYEQACRRIAIHASQLKLFAQ